MPSFSIPFQLLSSTALNSMVISIIGSTISMATTVAMATITTYTVHTEISAVCKFHSHLHIQQKFNL